VGHTVHFGNSPVSRSMKKKKLTVACSSYSTFHCGCPKTFLRLTHTFLYTFPSKLCKYFTTQWIFIIFSTRQFERTLSAVPAFLNTQNLSTTPADQLLFLNEISLRAAPSLYWEHKEFAIMLAYTLGSSLVSGQIPFCFIASS